MAKVFLVAMSVNSSQSLLHKLWLHCQTLCFVSFLLLYFYIEQRDQSNNERQGTSTPPESPSAAARAQRLREATRARRQLMVATALAAAQAGAPIRQHRASPENLQSPPPLEDLMESDDNIFPVCTLGLCCVLVELYFYFL